MLIWLFSILDFVVLFDLIVTHYNWLISPILILFSIIYLIAKGIIFFGELLSMLDLLVALYFILFLFGINVSLLFYFGVIFLIYKIIMGFMS